MRVFQRRLAQTAFPTIVTLVPTIIRTQGEGPYKDVEFRKIAYKALCCDRLKVTSQLVSFQSQNLSLV